MVGPESRRREKRTLELIYSGRVRHRRKESSLTIAGKLPFAYCPGMEVLYSGGRGDVELANTYWHFRNAVRPFRRGSAMSCVCSVGQVAFVKKRPPRSNRLKPAGQKRGLSRFAKSGSPIAIPF